MRVLAPILTVCITIFCSRVAADTTGVFIIPANSDVRVIIDGRVVDMPSPGFVPLDTGKHIVKGTWGYRMPAETRVTVNDSAVDTISLKPKFVRVLISPRVTLGSVGLKRGTLDLFCVSPTVGIRLPLAEFSLSFSSVMGEQKEFIIAGSAFMAPTLSESWNLLVGGRYGVYVNTDPGDSFSRYPPVMAVRYGFLGGEVGGNHTRFMMLIGFGYANEFCLATEAGINISF